MKNEYDKLLESENYKEYAKNNPKAYLANVFSMIQRPDSQKEWQFGFYNEEDDMLQPFIVHVEGSIETGKADKIFREPNAKVEEISLDEVKIKLEDAVVKAKEIGAEKFPGIFPVKYICILQKKETIMWNITIIGSNISTANIRIDADNGKLIHASMVNLFEKMKS